MIKAIIFDCFGVLVTEAWLPFKKKYFGHDPDLMEEVSQISHRADLGLISRTEAIQTTANLAGITPDEFLEAIGGNIPDEELFAYIRELKRKYKIGFLSNISDDYLHRLFTPEQVALFDAITLSFEIGYIKPQPEAYQLSAKQLSVRPAEAIFVDDQKGNINGAVQAGMPAILYRDTAQFKAELKLLISS